MDFSVPGSAGQEMPYVISRLRDECDNDGGTRSFQQAQHPGSGEKRHEEDVRSTKIRIFPPRDNIGWSNQYLSSLLTGAGENYILHSLERWPGDRKR